MTHAESQRPDEMRPSWRLLFVPIGFAGALASMIGIPLIGQHDTLRPVFLGAAGFLVVWAVAVFAMAHRSGQRLQIEFSVKRQHWVQACAQFSIFLYWGWYVRTVYGFLVLILGQVLFAFGVDALLNWSRRGVHRLTFGPLPIIFSINLFLLFRPSWFHWQFVMVLVGYLAKDLIRWERDGRSAHIFNPSSFPLGVSSLILLTLGATDITLGQFIAQSQFTPPHIYALIFLVSIPGQLLFGVARMTLAAVLSMTAISMLYFATTGTYMFRDAFISLPVFLGMHLLFTDPSTSPRTEAGQVMFGALYALGITGFYFLLNGLGLPTFYEKLLPVPLMNLSVRRIDRIARSDFFRALDPARIAAGLTPMGRNFAYTSGWVGVFAIFSSFQIVGDSHPGQYYPFWRDACTAGSERACEYQAFMTYNYCDRGSAWACNEYGIYLASRRFADEAREKFAQSCDGGFGPGCENLGLPSAPNIPRARGAPRLEDLPVVLRGSKGPVRETDPDRLKAMACDQGWPLCGVAPPVS